MLKNYTPYYYIGDNAESPEKVFLFLNCYLWLSKQHMWKLINYARKNRQKITSLEGEPRNEAADAVEEIIGEEGVDETEIEAVVTTPHNRAKSSSSPLGARKMIVNIMTPSI